MTLLRWFPVLLCGCLVVPATRTTTRDLGMRDGQVYEDGNAGLEMKGEAKSNQIVVHATRLLDCHRAIYSVTQIHRELHVAIGGAKDPRARAFGVVLAPLTMPISAVVSALIVLDDDGETLERTRVDHTEKLRCTRPAQGVAVELVVPSGRVLRGRADANGVATITLPLSEPYHGLAVARAETASTRVAFARPEPAVSAVRDAALACAMTQPRTGAVRIVLTIDARGRASDLRIAGDSDLAGCIRTVIAAVTFPPSQRASTLVLPLDLEPRG
jgi:hypothetical protein